MQHPNISEVFRMKCPLIFHDLSIAFSPLAFSDTRGFLVRWSCRYRQRGTKDIRLVVAFTWADRQPHRFSDGEKFIPMLLGGSVWFCGWMDGWMDLSIDMSAPKKTYNRRIMTNICIYIYIYISLNIYIFTCTPGWTFDVRIHYH